MPASRSIVLLHGVQSSRLSWWRISADLADLGWHVLTPDLLGHGDRAAFGPDHLSVQDLAADVLEQVAAPVDVLVGHSLGAIVALTALQLRPGFARAAVLEDPPGLSGVIELDDVADEIASSVSNTRADPTAACQAVLAENPTWSLVDAQNAVRNRLRLDVDRVTEFLRTDRWDLQALVNRCTVPVHLVVASRDTALTEPDRTAIMSLLTEDAVTVIDSGHNVHRERPGLWLHAVLQFAERRA